MTMPTLTEPPWKMAELKHAISRLKMKKGGDDVGLVAELLKHSPDYFLNALLHVMKEVLTSGNVPSDILIRLSLQWLVLLQVIGRF